jgi:hypothetical protein
MLGFLGMGGGSRDFLNLKSVDVRFSIFDFRFTMADESGNSNFGLKFGDSTTSICGLYPLFSGSREIFLLTTTVIML